MNSIILKTAVGLLVLLAMSSCMRFQTGEMIRSTAAAHCYWDIHHAENNSAYQLSAHQFAMQVPEMKYKPRLKWVFFDTGELKSSKYHADNALATGKSQWLGFELSDAEAKPLKASHVCVLEESPQLLQLKSSATAIDVTSIQFDENPLEVQIVEAGRPSTVQMLSAIPFDYLIDPTLSVTTTAITYAGIVAASPLLLLFNAFE